MTGARFRGTVAVVTGAARGFGAAFARAFAAEGAAVAMLDVDGPAVAEAAAGIDRDGVPVLGMMCDVVDETAVARTIAAVREELGEVAILVNNAGLHLTHYNRPFAELGAADTRRLFDVNVHGVVVCTLACAPSMARRGGGSVVNLSSLSAYQVTSPYGVSKLAVRGLTTAFAAQLGGDGIRVNAWRPD